MCRSIDAGNAGGMDTREHIVFKREYTPVLKGIAIIFMFAVHLLKPEWMTHPEWIIDVYVAGMPLAAVLARVGDICIGIFAFITGYGFSGGFHKKSVTQRLFKGGIYFSYLIVLLLFCFPIRVLESLLVTGNFPAITVAETVRSLTALSSQSVKYCWYVLFFALAVVTYAPCEKLLNRIKLSGYWKVAGVCIAGFGMRYVGRKLTALGMPYDALSVWSHYFQWMPVVLTGSIARRENLLENLDELRRKWFKKLTFAMTGWVIVASILLAKIILQTVFGIYSNLDSFYILPFMYGLILTAESIVVRMPPIAKILKRLGDFSLYMWLAHCVLLMGSVQEVLYRLRFPIVILVAGLAVMYPVGYILAAVDRKLQRKLF